MPCRVCSGRCWCRATLALLIDVFPENERAAAIGSWTAWTGIATVIGPLGGGALVQLVSWRLIFAVNLLPVAITLWLLRNTGSDVREPGHVDIPGAALCALGLGGPVFALIEQPTYGWGDVRVMAPLIAGVALFVAFLAWEGRSPQPMMPLALFKRRNFAVGNLTTLTLYAGLGVATFFLVLFLQQVGGYTPISAGLALLPMTVVMFLFSRRFAALADRLGPHYFMGGGPLVAGAGLLLLIRTGAGADYVTMSCLECSYSPWAYRRRLHRLPPRCWARSSPATLASPAGSTTRSRGWRVSWRSPPWGRSWPAASPRGWIKISRAGR